MRKTTLLICFFAVAFFWTSTTDVFATSRFTEGFLGITWRTPKTELPDLGISKKMFANIYSQGPSAILFMEGIGTIPMLFEDVPLVAIYLRFQDACFSGVDFLFSPEHHNRIRLLVENDMGLPGSTCDEGVCWLERNLSITLTNRELLVVYLSD